MTLTELRYIVTLAREKHFGHAAERCHVSQPTLSVAVRKLEDELGVPLFERSKNSIQVTEIGRRIVDQAQRVLDQAGVIQDLAEDGKNQLNSPLKVGPSTPSVPTSSRTCFRSCAGRRRICRCSSRKATPVNCASSCAIRSSMPSSWRCLSRSPKW